MIIRCTSIASSLSRGPIPGGAPGNPYGTGPTHQIPSGPPVSASQPPIGLKTAQMPPSMPQGPASLGPPGNTPNGHPLPNNVPSANGGAPVASQASNSNPAQPFMTGFQPGQPNSLPTPSVNNLQPINASQNSQFVPPSSSNIQSATITPSTGMAMGGRAGPPPQNMPYSQGPPSSNGPIPPGVSSPPRPPAPGAFGSPPQFQQAQYSQRPGEMSQNPTRPQMMGMPPMPPSYQGGASTMTSTPGQMMPPPPMGGPGGMRPPGMGPMPPSSMGGYPSNSTGINTSSSVSRL